MDEERQGDIPGEGAAGAETDWPSIKPDLTGGDEDDQPQDPEDPGDPPRGD